MEEPRKDLLMQVGGMKGEACRSAVTAAVRTLDPDADVEVDLDHARVHVRTTAQSIDVAQALTKAGFEATAMTG